MFAWATHTSKMASLMWELEGSVLGESVYWGNLCTQGVCVLGKSVYWGCLCTRGVCTARVCVLGESVYWGNLCLCTEKVCVPREPVYWGSLYTGGVCVLRESVYWWSLCTEGVCVLREYVYWGSMCTEGVCVLREYVYWGSTLMGDLVRSYRFDVQVQHHASFWLINNPLMISQTPSRIRADFISHNPLKLKGAIYLCYTNPELRSLCLAVYMLCFIKKLIKANKFIMLICFCTYYRFIICTNIRLYVLIMAHLYNVLKLSKLVIHKYVYTIIGSSLQLRTSKFFSKFYNNR